MKAPPTEQQKISVVTITLNRRDMLKEAIESVLAQNYPDLEHIVVDGGSTDATVELLKSYSHLRWISEPDQGQADAINKGLRMATGEIFAWLNSDDTYPAGTFETVSRYFAAMPDLAMLYGTCNIVDHAGLQIGRSRFHKLDLRRILMGFNNINTPAVFVRAQAVREAGWFDKRLKATYDVDMWIRIAQRCRVLPVPDTLSNLRLHQGSGLVSTRLHLREIPALREKYWSRRTVWERLVTYPYLSFRTRAYEVLKFGRLARQARGQSLKG